ncbi:MAG TPA: hypothetical protein VF466_03950 [Candidatus Saccharimonadales bacterium]
MKAIQELVNDPLAYLESAGKYDKSNLAAALQDGGRNTTIRVCLWRSR